MNQDKPPLILSLPVIPPVTDPRQPPNLTDHQFTSSSSLASEDYLSSSDEISIIIHPESTTNSHVHASSLHHNAELSDDMSSLHSDLSVPNLTTDEEEEEEDYHYSSDEEDINESLSTTIIQEIQDGTYTCLVCTCEIDQTSTVWSCDNCYRVYDLECIKDWAIRGSSTNKQNKNWRCPSCNIEHKKIPNRFTCWCGRITNPNSNSLVPFSCGNSCNYKYGDCIHSCSSVCHPGKHPVCGAMGPLMKCKCGKCERQLPCLITPYEDRWQCENECEIEVCELGHKCSSKQCHLGFCGPCVELVATRSYCGQHVLEVPCHTRDPKICYKNGVEFVGGTACDDITIVHYDCGIHYEELTCQPLPEKTKACKFSPEVVKQCYCGKTTVDNLKRTKCTDPMPTCDSVCGKLLKCGCRCLAQCHPGECVCYNFVEAKCNCENTTFLVPCKFVQDGYKPKCKLKCPVMLNCRRHYHREVCCPTQQVALKREKERKKQIRNRVRANFDDDNMTIEPNHICTRTCNRLKLCGLHYCEAMCHNGPCGVCLESTNEDLVCACGKTVVPAPVRCGTVIDCHEQCSRPKACGHPPEPHECHDELKPCPKCTKLVKKACNCGIKKDIPNVLCSQENVSCGKICTVKKDCGHPCLKVCAKGCVDGIHDQVANCQSVCHALRKTCPHYCKLKCHALKKGNCDSVTCKEQVTITCECGLRSKRVSCGSSNLEVTKIGTFLECDDACVKAKRDAELKSALVDDVISQPFENPYNSDITLVYQRQTTWCLKIETLMRDFISDYQDQVASGADGAEIKKSYNFPPMPRAQRSFIHNLCASYKLYSESQDKEPQRSVFFMITDRTSVPPLTIQAVITLEEDIKRKELAFKEIKEMELADAYFNAIILQDVFFGVVREDIETHTTKILEGFKYEIKEPCLQWMKESTYIFYSKVDYKEMDVEKENKLYMLMKTFKNVLRDNLIAFDCKLCMVDSSADVILKIDEKNIVTSKVEVEEKKKSSNSFDVFNSIEAV